MVRDIELLLKAPIEKRRLPDFNYGEFEPEAQFRGKPTRKKSSSNSQQHHNRVKQIPGVAPVHADDEAINPNLKTEDRT
jgi:hypothetical protein